MPINFNGAAYPSVADAVSPTFIRLVDDFVGGTNGSIGTVGEIGWQVWGPSGSISRPTVAYPNYGTRSLDTGTTANNAMTLYLAERLQFQQSTNWQMTFVFSMPSTAACDIIVGGTNDNGAIGIGKFGSTSFGCRYSSALDTNFNFFSKNTDLDWSATNDATNFSLNTGVAANTSYNNVRMRSNSLGVIEMQINNGPWLVVTMVTTISNGWIPFIYVSTRTNAVKSLSIDYFSFIQTGVSR